MKKIIMSLDLAEGIIGNGVKIAKSDSVIVDNEIMNDISDDWDYYKGKICLTGMLYEDVIEIYIAESENDADFKIEVSSRLEELHETGMRIYALNNKFELGTFAGNLGCSCVIEEIRTFKGKGSSKDNMFSVLNKHGIINAEVRDVLNGDSAKCVDLWKDYKKTGNFLSLLTIAVHNINCLVKESIILKNKQWFIDNVKTDMNGFAIGEVK